MRFIALLDLIHHSQVIQVHRLIQQQVCQVFRGVLPAIRRLEHRRQVRLELIGGQVRRGGERRRFPLIFLEVTDVLGAGGGEHLRIV